jgi:DnaJ-class molecular chaperone
MIKRLFEKNMDLIVKAGVEVCKTCKGTGLSSYARMHSSYYWNDGEYCDKCASIGYVNLDKIFDVTTKDDCKFLCRKCYGIGCEECDNGFVDWVSHAKGK